MRGIRESGKDIGPEGKKTLKLGMNLIAARARGSMRSRSGGGGYPRNVAGAVTVRSTTLKLSKSGGFPYAFGAEFGANHVWVFGQVMKASSAGFRQFAPFGGSGFTLRGRTAGYHIGPAIKELEPLITKDLNDAVNQMIVNDQRKRGVKSRVSKL